MFKNTIHPHINIRLIESGRQKRREMTQAEKIFWSRVRNRRFKGMKFQRKHHLPHSITDFYCPEHHLVVEVDGSVQEAGDQHHLIQDVEFAPPRLRVLRFTNHDILGNLENVLREIETQIT